MLLTTVYCLYFDSKQGLTVFDGLRVLDEDFGDDAVGVSLNLVHQLHRFDDAERFAVGDRVADVDEGFGGRRGRAIKRADEGRGDDVQRFFGRCRCGCDNGWHSGRRGHCFRRKVVRDGFGDDFGRTAASEPQAEGAAFEFEISELLFGDQMNQLFDLVEREIFGLSRLRFRSRLASNFRGRLRRFCRSFRTCRFFHKDWDDECRCAGPQVAAKANASTA